MADIHEIPGGFDEPSAVTQAAAIPGGSAVAEGGNFALPNFSRAIGKNGGAANGGPIDLLKDVDLNVKIELGRTKMLIEDVLRLAEGSVVELDKLAGDPVDVYVNDQLVARGEVLVLNDNFCVRVNEIVTTAEEG
jgi:flagellar motor switch protein FliN/FliY